MREPTVNDVMTRCPVAVRASASFEEIVNLLAGNKVSAVPVLDSRGSPIGVVSEADLLSRRARWSNARELMSSPVLAVSPDEPVSGAVARLARAGVRRLFVVDNRRLVGVLSRRDLLRGYLREDADIREQIERTVLPRLPIDTTWVRVSVRDGVVLLIGRVEWRSERAVLEAPIRTVRGVVEVHNRLGFIWNDAFRDESLTARHTAGRLH